MRVNGLVRKYLGQGRMMQIATVKGDQPWICTVYYVPDDELSLYWLSLPTRRHSQEIAEHDKVAAAIAIKHESKPVIGIQVEGVAQEISDLETIASVMKLYVDKYSAGKDFYNNFVAGKNQHRLYRIKPTLFVLFDEVTFKEDTRREWRP